MKKILFAIVCMVILIGCNESDFDPIIDKNAPAPLPVSEVRVKNLHGGAVLHYKLPNDKNLLYVKAEYEIRPGVTRETKASFYGDSVLLDGFSKLGAYEVKLYSVGRNEKISDPVLVTVTPDEAPVNIAFDDLIIEEGFGGVKIRFANKYRKDLAYCLIVDKNDNELWDPLETFYTKSATGVFSHRGLEPTPVKVGAYIRDRWGNTSDTLVSTLTPLYEYMIPKPYGLFNLASDSYLPAEGNAGRYALEKIWDGVTNALDNNIFANTHDSPMPQTFTANLKQSVVLSRIKVHHRTKNEYMGSAVKKFELYGSNSTNPGNDLDGGDWILLGRFDSYKPSGLGPVTAEDREYANVQGENFELEATDEIPNPWVPVRFIRFRTLETYNGPSNRGQVVIAEISLFGQSSN